MRLFGKKQTAPEPTVGAGSGSIEMVPMLELNADEIEEFDRRAELQRSRAMPSPDASMVPSYTAALRDPSWEVRREAAIALCERGDHDAFQAIGQPVVERADPDLVVDATIAFARVMLDPRDGTIASGLNMNAGLMLAALLAGDPDERVRRAASWAFGKIPPTGAEPGTAPIGLLTRWFMLRSAEIVRAGKKELAEPDRTQFLAQADQIEADRRAREPVMASAPAGVPDLPPPPPM